MISSKALGVIWRGIRWLAGEDAPRPAAPAVDRLEPYCSEQVLQQRLHDAGTVPMGTAKAIHKIGARYGAQL